MKSRNLSKAQKDHQLEAGRNIPFTGQKWQVEQMLSVGNYVSPWKNRATRRAEERSANEQNTGVIGLDTQEIGRTENGRIITRKRIGYRLRVQNVKGKKIVHYDRQVPVCSVRFGKGEV